MSKKIRLAGKASLFLKGAGRYLLVRKATQAMVETAAMPLLVQMNFPSPALNGSYPGADIHHKKTVAIPVTNEAVNVRQLHIWLGLATVAPSQPANTPTATAVTQPTSGDAIKAIIR